MSKFIVKFAMDNAAFGDEATMEVCMILRHIASQVTAEPSWKGGKRKVYDSNGNVVGTWEYKP